nr:putative alcohol dehydrogenase superfamily, zinc-type [Tanacetum cinerariifolium]
MRDNVEILTVRLRTWLRFESLFQLQQEKKKSGCVLEIHGGVHVRHGSRKFKIGGKVGAGLVGLGGVVHVAFKMAKAFSVKLTVFSTSSAKKQ